MTQTATKTYATYKDIMRNSTMDPTDYYKGWTPEQKAARAAELAAELAVAVKTVNERVGKDVFILGDTPLFGGCNLTPQYGLTEYGATLPEKKLERLYGEMLAVALENAAKSAVAGK